MSGSFFVYILASKKNGVTNDLARRMTEHKAKLVPGLHPTIWRRSAGVF
jgi:putative endonuclease